MTYFKIVSIVLGGWMVLGGAWAVFAGQSLQGLVLKLYPEARPRWIPVTGALMLLWTIGTWAAFVKAASMENFVVALVVSLGLAKIAPLVFYYKKSREILLALLAEPLAFRVVVLSSAAIGAGLLVMGIFF